MKITDFFKSKNTTKTFTDPPNTAVFTTKFVIFDNKDITHVTHEIEDGAWQFFSDDEFEHFEDVAKIVGLQEIIKRDNSILELADLPLGYLATRKNKDEKWEIKKADQNT
ncbi:hypothetical protein A5893_15390 [Pedobacter psychrophilus]|uniref:Immunity protein Imm33 domain-containing protein n=1 Tax=Pedobacter psychrophilus TaxID=1826909 RepID=A0A179DBV6_9SPHI|nr:DUF2185 domain-containing protein [Pedobacter psychrophilus]OAQ38180.1 hypothetical protein A5893_15390 [Pedobacter psychrophilus]